MSDDIHRDIHRIDDTSRILTPALVLYPEIIDANIANTIRLLGGDVNRWRPHVKTSKLGWTVRRLLEHGVRAVKCSTTLELLTACEAGVGDALLAYPVVNANATRVRAIAAQFPGVRVSALVENVGQLSAWADAAVGIFIDVNSGMNRTGIDPARAEEVLRVARAAGARLRGLHFYDGHLGDESMVERTVIAHEGYDRLMELVAFLESSGVSLEEVITSGTPAFPCAMAYQPFRQGQWVHRVSPGTVVYGDCTSSHELPDMGYRTAVLVLATVVSHPRPGRITCDAGHKAVSADAGVPTCRVLGRPDLEPQSPNEEHLPITVKEGAPVPAIGDTLYLLPRHVCPTVNNFDHAVLVVRGRVEGVERVTARGREAPLS